MDTFGLWKKRVQNLLSMIGYSEYRFFVSIFVTMEIKPVTPFLFGKETVRSFTQARGVGVGNRRAIST
tara:strand:- start:264 stop:467 length:204 start_codon:yes stop_codon:yes gene_type:complete